MPISPNKPQNTQSQSAANKQSKTQNSKVVNSTTNKLTEAFENSSSIASKASKPVKKKVTVKKQAVKKKAVKVSNINEKTLQTSAQATDAVATKMQTASEIFAETSKEMFAFLSHNFENNVEAVKKGIQVKTLNEFFELQNEIIKKNVESCTKQSEKINKIYSKASKKSA